MTKRSAKLLLSLVLVVLVLCGCGKAKSNTRYEKLMDVNGKRIAVLDGTLTEQMLPQQVPDVKISTFISYGDMALALQTDIVDGFATDSINAYNIMRSYGNLYIIPEPYADIPSGFLYPKTEKGVALRDQMNEFLKTAHADGTIETLEAKWLSGPVPEDPEDYSVLHQGGPVLHAATSGSILPFTYYYGDKLTGYDIELAYRFCEAYGYDLEFDAMNFSGLLPGIVSQRYDFAASCASITEERKESVHFSDPTSSLKFIIVAKDYSVAASEESFFESLIGSFEKTFLRESRWTLIVSGIGVTVYLSLMSVLFGTALGFGVCMLRRVNCKPLQVILNIYVRIIQGTPLVVLLMILFYLVFAHSPLSAPTVAIIAFSLNFAAYVSEVMRSGIESIDKGQREAALALGYTKSQAFFRIVMPQAARQFLPVYKGEFISLVKMTSIVGYIAVQDLTKVSDIIRSRTYEAFFPLITTAVIYFLISNLMTFLLKALERKVEPNRNDRTVKGVKMQ